MPGKYHDSSNRSISASILRIRSGDFLPIFSASLLTVLITSDLLALSNIISRAGMILTLSARSMDLWVFTSNHLTESISSPKNSILTALSASTGNISTMPPLTAYCPLFSTNSTLSNAATVSLRINSSGSRRLLMFIVITCCIIASGCSIL